MASLPADATFRVSFFFEQRGDLNFGGTLNFWSQLASLELVQAQLDPMQRILNNCTGKGNNIIKARVSDISRFRQIYVKRYPPLYEPEGNEGDADIATSAGLLELRSGARQVTRQWIRGMRDGAITQAGRLHLDGAQLTALKKLYAQLKNTDAGWCMRAQDPAAPQSVLSAITGAGVVTAVAHGIDSLQYVRISRTAGVPLLNRVWQVVVLSPDTFQLLAFPGFVDPIHLTKTGRVKRVNKVPIQIASAEVTRATSHRTGRPFDLASGRRRTRPK